MSTEVKKIQLAHKVLIKGTIETLTGLHIGGSNTELSIGGIDSAVIRNPITNEPYIPGSSLKGKMRSLIELRDGTVGGPVGGQVKNGPSTDPDNLSSKLFGVLPKDKDQKNRQRPSRILVRDAKLVNGDTNEIFRDADLPFSEVKTEVVIDRITSAAMPRQIERVPAGAKFDLDLVVNIFEGEQSARLVATTLDALLMLQDDYVGGNGSRGYGQIKFHITEMTKRTVSFYLNDAEEQPSVKGDYTAKEKYKSLFE